MPLQKHMSYRAAKEGKHGQYYLFALRYFSCRGLELLFPSLFETVWNTSWFVGYV